MIEKYKGESPKPPEVGPEELERDVQNATETAWQSVRAADRLKSEFGNFSRKLSELKQAGAFDEEAERSIRESFDAAKQKFEALHEQVCAACNSSETVARALSIHIYPDSPSVAKPEDSAQRDRTEYEARRYR